MNLDRTIQGWVKNLPTNYEGSPPYRLKLTRVRNPREIEISAWDTLRGVREHITWIGEAFKGNSAFMVELTDKEGLTVSPKKRAATYPSLSEALFA